MGYRVQTENSETYDGEGHDLPEAGLPLEGGAQKDKFARQKQVDRGHPR